MRKILLGLATCSMLVVSNTLAVSQQGFSKMETHNQKVNNISVFLDNYFEKRNNIIEKNVENIKNNIKHFNDTEKLYIKKYLDLEKQYNKDYKDLIYSWYSLVPILTKKIDGEQYNKISLNYHIKDFKNKLVKTIKLQKILLNLKYAYIGKLTNSITDELQVGDNFDKNYKIYSLKNLIDINSGKQINYMKLILNTKLHKLNPYRAFHIVYIGDLIRGFKLVAINN